MFSWFKRKKKRQTYSSSSTPSSTDDLTTNVLTMTHVLNVIDDHPKAPADDIQNNDKPMDTNVSTNHHSTAINHHTTTSHDSPSISADTSTSSSSGVC